jgi:hypothetical protein
MPTEIPVSAIKQTDSDFAIWHLVKTTVPRPMSWDNQQIETRSFNPLEEEHGKATTLQ